MIITSSNRGRFKWHRYIIVLPLDASNYIIKTGYPCKVSLNISLVNRIIWD